ncbi:hypothetical protein IscW_ISCW018787 [Ixodes scapularis]|uniref:Uncharacterized protein n=1 Tax=Ixodes scapularis TaxID=6945 RepID=B7PLJ9_IXOSC|nr:hypothetical protein IscW_ISCW018787 [Ixodes scapularis]|eukprot:XP_002434647.1 hypothetical protein IscW_ISCW018787 [Ixodes scapularis]
MEKVPPRARLSECWTPPDVFRAHPGSGRTVEGTLVEPVGNDMTHYGARWEKVYLPPLLLTFRGTDQNSPRRGDQFGSGPLATGGTCAASKDRRMPTSSLDNGVKNNRDERHSSLGTPSVARPRTYATPYIRNLDYENSCWLGGVSLVCL